MTVDGCDDDIYKAPDAIFVLGVFVLRKAGDVLFKTAIT
jgi:hypothetical protein